MNADTFIQCFIECHQKDGKSVLLHGQGTENNRDYTSLKISTPKNDYYLTVYSNSATKEILFFKTFGEIDFMLSILNNIKTKKTFYGFEVLKLESKLGSLMTPSVITVLAMTHMDRFDMLTEDDMREFAKHFSIDRIVGILNKQNWTKRGIEFLYGELYAKEEEDQYQKEKEQAKQDCQDHDDWVKDCREQARNMGYDV